MDYIWVIPVMVILIVVITIAIILAIIYSQGGNKTTSHILENNLNSSL